MLMRPSVGRDIDVTGMPEEGSGSRLLEGLRLGGSADLERLWEREK